VITLISLNSSIDQVYVAEKFSTDAVNRVKLAYRGAGGKTINVAKVLNMLHVPIHCIAFVAGTTGQLIKQEIQNINLPATFLQVDGTSRFCSTILAQNTTTEILEDGHYVSDERFQKLLETCIERAHGTMYFVVTGSIPNGMTMDQYKVLIDTLKSTGKPLVIDTSGQALKIAYGCRPDVLKPNEEEFKALVGNGRLSISELKHYLLQMKDKPNYFFVTLGRDGALLCYKQLIYYAQCAKNIEAINAVGSGDSFLAGFLAGLYQKKPVEKCIQMAMAAGIVNAMSLEIATVNMESWEAFQQEVIVTILEG